MGTPLESAAEEVERLRGFLNDLESILALPSLRAGGEPAQIVSILLDTLVGMPGLAFAFVQLDDPEGELSIKTAKVTEALERSICTGEIGEALEMALGDVPLKWPPSGRLSIGDMKFSISSTILGLQGEFGVLVAGSQKLDFPERTESFLLDVAASRAAMALQRARLLGSQKRGATEVAGRETPGGPTLTSGSLPRTPSPPVNTILDC